MSSPIERMIDAAMVCGRCGAPCGHDNRGRLTCPKGCTEYCSCGWIAERGKPCTNPETARCSTKVNYGKYNRRTKRYE